MSAHVRHLPYPPVYEHRPRDCQQCDGVEDRGKQVSCHGHLCPLKEHGLGVPRNLGPDLDPLFSQRRQRPIPDQFRQGRSPQEVAQVFGQRKEMNAGLVVPERMAGERRSLHRVAAGFDPRTGRPTTVVELDHLLGSLGETW